MLQQLQVKNYAIIDDLTISFSSGLNIITGETGAGKSILLGALGLVLGDRADHSALFDKDKKCIVEGQFNIAPLALQHFFENYELDYDDVLILRRELLPSMRSRAFINDTPVNLKTVQALAEQLINVHRQFATLDIFRRSFQTKILDTLATQNDLMSEYQQAYSAYRSNIRQLEILNAQIATASRDNDFIQFQINEINELNPEVESDARLQLQLNQAEHVEEIKNELGGLLQILAREETNLSSLIEMAVYKSNALTKYGADFESINDRLSAIKVELDDLTNEVMSINDNQELDPASLNHLRSRYDALQRLYFKHQVADSAALLELLEGMQSKLSSSEQAEAQRNELTDEIEKQEKSLKSIALKLRERRLDCAPELKKQVESALHHLAMSNAQFTVHVDSSDHLHELGLDEVTYLFSANPGTPGQSLQQAASGGELSRLSLALKSIVAKELALPTMVFDEIDSGVSGDTALRMGSMLKGLGDAHQTIVITHSAQVAAQGVAHYFVSKESVNGSTKTSITKLNKKERKNKIAIMLSSDPPTTAAEKNAEELLLIGKEK